MPPFLSESNCRAYVATLVCTVSPRTLPILSALFVIGVTSQACIVIGTNPQTLLVIRAKSQACLVIDTNIRKPVCHWRQLANLFFVISATVKPVFPLALLSYLAHSAAHRTSRCWTCSKRAVCAHSSLRWRLERPSPSLSQRCVGCARRVSQPAVFVNISNARWYLLHIYTDIHILL